MEKLQLCLPVVPFLVLTATHAAPEETISEHAVATTGTLAESLKDGKYCVFQLFYPAKIGTIGTTHAHLIVYNWNSNEWRGWGSVNDSDHPNFAVYKGRADVLKNQFNLWGVVFKFEENGRVTQVVEAGTLVPPGTEVRGQFACTSISFFGRTVCR